MHWRWTTGTTWPVIQWSLRMKLRVLHRPVEVAFHKWSWQAHRVHPGQDQLQVVAFGAWSSISTVRQVMTDGILASLTRAGWFASMVGDGKEGSIPCTNLCQWRQKSWQGRGLQRGFFVVEKRTSAGMSGLEATLRMTMRPGAATRSYKWRRSKKQRAVVGRALRLLLWVLKGTVMVALSA